MKQCFIVPAQMQWTCFQRLSPKNKGVLAYIPLQASYRSKKLGLTHIWFAYILTPSATWPYSCLDSLSLSPSYAIPSSLLHYQNTNFLVSFLALLPATLRIKPKDSYLLGGYYTTCAMSISPVAFQFVLQEGVLLTLTQRAADHNLSPSVTD
jgi:hypothetical protein